MIESDSDGSAGVGRVGIDEDARQIRDAVVRDVGLGRAPVRDLLRVGAGLERCAHGRCAIDPCVGCGRRWVDGVLVGRFDRG